MMVLKCRVSTVSILVLMGYVTTYQFVVTILCLQCYVGFIVSLTATPIPQDISLTQTPPGTPNVDLDITYCVGVVNSTSLYTPSVVLEH